MSVIALITSFLNSVIGAATPILYAAVGEIYTERSGLLNLGLEGLMLMGAVCGYATLIQTGSTALALVSAMLVGLLVGFIFALLTTLLRADQTVCGITLTLFCSGLSGYIGKFISIAPAPASFKAIPLPLLSKIPVLGEVLFTQDAMVYLLYIIVAFSCWFIYKTRWGLELRTIGENPAAADALGINVYGLRYLYTSIGGMLTAMGGAYLTLAYAPAWREGVTDGKGWIAIALVIFSAWHPAKAVLGALLFGGITVLALRLQLTDIVIPTHFISMLPYLCTVIVLMLSVRKGHSDAPSALTIPFDRESR